MLTVICRRYVLQGKLPADWPKIYFKDKIFNKQNSRLMKLSPMLLGK
jgi:hypothetical protein